ncbi:hypothetical protein JCM11251_004152 [Rhodosporidiobolus azoricus]
MASTQPGLKVALHPAAILNISDHHTRTSINTRNPHAKVFGALLGTQSGREVDIMTSFEIVVAPSASSSKVEVDHAYFVTRRDQFRQVFPTFDFLGWYSVGTEPGQEEAEVHKQFFTYNESPLFLQLQPPHASSTPSSSSKDLPLTIYESTLELVPTHPSSEPQPVFVPAAYEIETGEAERVAVDEVSKPSGGAGEGGTHSGLLAALSTQRSALSMLQDRIAIILRYLTAISSPSPSSSSPDTSPPVRKDPETLRQIAALVASLEGAISSAGVAIDGSGEEGSEAKKRIGSVEQVEEKKEKEKGKGEKQLGPGEFEREFLTEYNDVLLTNYLAALTKQVSSANELLDKHLLLSSSASGPGSGSGSGGVGGGEGRGGRGGAGGRKGAFGGGGKGGVAGGAGRLGEMMFS